MKTNATISIEEITPKQAKELLTKLYHQQRSLRGSWVNRLVGEIRTGNFKLSCDALVIVDGMLLNGQHRMNAVVQSEIPCPFLVLRSDDPQIYQIIDAGIKRTISDVITGEYRSIISGAAVWIMQYENNAISINSRNGGAKAWNRVILRSKLIQFIDNNRNELEICAARVTSAYRQAKFLSPAAALAVAFLANRERNSDIGIKFIETLFAGNHNKVIKILRDKLINNRLTKKKWNTSYTFGLIIKTFKLWESNTLAEDIRIKATETFPTFKL